MHFSKLGWKVIAADSFIKRKWEHELGVSPLFQIETLHKRAEIWNKKGNGEEVIVETLDVTKHRALYKCLEKYRPDTILHFGEQPSAPYSMLDREKAVETQINNITGTINIAFAVKAVNPDIHIVKVGTMGEYGQPNIDIEEGWIEIEHKGRTDRLLYPKSAGSFYHLSKVHDSNNLEFMCRTWGLRVTDLNQGIVYGLTTPETKIDKKLGTSFHYDDIFGTVINRFMVQAHKGIPLTIYGNGGKTRAMLNINDTLKCVEISANNKAAKGEFRVFNQFTEQLSIDEIASLVQKAYERIGVSVTTQNINNPRVEKEEHYFNAINNGLINLGLKPTKLMNTLNDMAEELTAQNPDINSEYIIPRIAWNA